MNISVNLTKRMTTPEGQRFYSVVGANNGRIKPDWVWMDRKEVRCPKGTYYIDYTDSSGKWVRTSVGTVAAEAQASRLRKEAELPNRMRCLPSLRTNRVLPPSRARKSRGRALRYRPRGLHGGKTRLHQLRISPQDSHPDMRPEPCQYSWRLPRASTVFLKC